MGVVECMLHGLHIYRDLYPRLIIDLGRKSTSLIIFHNIILNFDQIKDLYKTDKDFDKQWESLAQKEFD